MYMKIEKSEVNVVRQVWITLVLIWTFVDKIRFNRDFKHARNTIFFSSSSFVSKRLSHFFYRLRLVDVDEQKEDRLLTDWLIRKARRSTIDMCRRLEEEDRQLTVVVADSLIDWLSEQEDLQLSRCVKIRFVASLTKTSCFVISQQENFRFVKMLYVNSSLCSHRFSMSLRERVFQQENFRLFFRRIWIVRQVKYIHRLQRQNFTLWRSYFTYSRISTSNLFQSERFDRVSINLAKLRTRNLAMLETVNHRHCWLKDFRAEDVKSSRIESLCFFLLVDDESECEVYIARHDKDQI